MRRHLRDLAAASILLLAACARNAPAETPVAPPPGGAIANAFTNGDFESDAIGSTPPAGWTIQTFLNQSGVSGTSSAPPSSLSALRLTGPGSGLVETFVVGRTEAPEPELRARQPDPDLGPGQAFRYPAYGFHAARVNYKDATDNGKNRNSNLLRQTMTVGLGDVDPADGLIHVRFAVAPVLENPAHSFSQQPYYFVELLNLTRGTKLYGAFNVAGQPGVPWKTTTSVVTGRATQWLDWQLVDIAPGNAALAVGDQVQLTVLAAGCSLGGHFARVYVDGIGSTIPGPFAWATAQQDSVHAGTTLTYTINYSNGGTAAAIGARVDFTTPPQTTFASVAGITGCTAPAAGSAGFVSCPLGTLQPGATGSFTVTVNVSASATGSIVAGNYAIAAVNAPTLLGAKVTTAVIASATSTADVNVTQTVAARVIPSGTIYGGATPLYTVTLANPTSWSISSKSGRTVTLTDVVPAGVTNVTWSCTATGGNGANASKCRDGDKNAATGASGAGNTITLAPRLSSGGGQIVVQVFGTVSAPTGSTVANTASFTLNGITDTNPANNTATTSFAVGTPVTLALTKSGGNANGIVASAPAGLACGTTCGSASATFVAGASVALTASPQAGATFAGWSGEAPEACTSGTPATCTVSMDVARAITATFTPRPAVGPAARVYVYSGNGQLGRSPGTFSAPLVVLVTDANGVAVNGAAVAFSAPASGATASLTATASTNASGLASVTATPNAVAGSYAVDATVVGAGTATFTLTNAGPPAHVTYVNGGDATDPQRAPVATAFAVPLLAVVTDAAGNVVPGATATFTVSPAGGASATLASGAASGASVTATSDASGFVSVTATANGTSGAYAVNATVAGVATPATFHLENATSTAAEIYVASGSPQTTAPSGAFAGSLVVAVADAWGNAVPGATVTFTAIPAAGATATLSNGTTSGAAVTATTGATGLASITATAGTTGGTFTVSASAPGVSSPAVFSLVIDGGHILQVSSGSPQTASLGAQFSPLQVQLLNADGDPVSGASVQYIAPASGATATLSASSASTGATGLAGVTGTAAAATGSYQVVASSPNAPSAVSFSLTNVCGTSSQCPATAPICDAGGGSCGTCTADTQCATRSAATPYCAAGACVACTQDSQCGGTTPVCDAGTSSCAPCTSDAQCGSMSAAAPVCNVSTGACSARAATVTLGAATLAATYDGTSKAVSVTTAPGGLAVSVTYDGSPTPPTHAGSYAVVATVTTEGYQGSATGTLVVARAPQAVTFTPPARAFGDAPFDLAAFASGGGSGNPVGFTVVSGPGSLGGTTLTLTGAGEIVLDASQAGSADYDAAPTVRRTLTVSPGATTTTLSATPPASVAGESVLFSVGVEASGGAPTGTVTVRDGATTVCTATLSGGAGSCSASSLGVGSHELTASYGGDAGFAASSSAATTLDVGKGAASAAVDFTPATPVSGQTVTFTTTVTATAPASGTPTGTVVVRDGETTVLCTATLSGGAGSCTSALGAGSHGISATYGGSASFEGASGSRALTVAKGTSSLSVVASPAPSIAGQPVTFTASVSAVAPASATPAGTVAFTDGATTLCAVAALSSGEATCTTSALAVGDHTVTAIWAGDASLTGSSGAAGHTVQPAASTTTLAATPNPARAGQPVTLTATVAAAGPGTPGGTVTFSDGGTTLCLARPLEGGAATCSTAALAVGDHTLAATYSGDGTFAGSSGTAALDVEAGAVAILVASAPSPSRTGEAVTFTATVSAVAPSAGVPTGAVTFTVGTTTLCAARPLAGGVATCASSGLGVGAHEVMATYPGDARFLPGAGSDPHTVSAGGTVVALEALPGAPVSGELVTFAVTVSPSAPAAGAPSGDVDVWDGTTLLCTAAVTNGAGSCSAALGAGGHDLTIAYGGGASWSASTASASVAVGKGSSTLDVVASPSPSTLGQPVTFTATVRAAAPAIAAPGGTVSFDDGATTLCAAAAVVAGEATCTVSSLGVGDHPVTATWTGDEQLGASSAGALHEVDAAGSTLALSAAPSPARTGQAVTLTATVTAAGGAPGTPGGTVHFSDGDDVLCAAAALSGGVATCTTSALAVASHGLSATYSGDGSFGGATGVAALEVLAGGVDVTLGASPSPSVRGQPVTFTAHVAAAAPAAGAPTGTVTFAADGVELCTARPLAGGAATCATTALALGAHAIAATYSGDARFLGGDGGRAHEVGAAPGTVAVASSRNPSRAGRPITFTASVHHEWAEPSGTVIFRSGERILGTATLAGGEATITIRDLTRGTHPVTAEFPGGAGLAAASGALAGGQAVENTPPVAGAGTALALGPGALRATAAVPAGALDAVQGAELWFRAGDGTADGATLLRLGPAAAPALAVGLRPGRAGVDVNAGGTILSAAAALDDGRWHHLAASAEDGTVTVLLDGVPVATGAATLDATGVQSVILGDGLSGAVDEVRLWTAPRSAAAILDELHRPVRGDAVALAALWRFDEASGAEAFDAGPAGVDLAVEVQDGAAAFAPSTAWRDRTATAGAPMARVDAGYDADGDPLALTLVEAPAHGAAALDAAALQVGYTPSARFGGVDGFTLRLDDGTATSDYGLRVLVTGGDLVCRADAECGEGAACVRGACTPVDELVGKGDRTGCSSPGTPASWLGAAFLLLLLRRRRPAALPARARRAPGALLLLAAASLAGPARAQTPAPIPVENYAPAPPGDPLFTTPAPDVPGHLVLTGGIALSYARAPLVLERDGERVDGGVLVQDQLWGFLQASLGVRERLRLDGALPVVISQGGQRPFADVRRVSRSSLGDLRLGGQLALGALGPVRMAAGLDLWLPSGAREAYATDGSPRAVPKMIVGGEAGRWVYGGQLGVLLARRLDVGYAATGSGVAFSAGAAWRSGAFRVGPEVWGQLGFGGTRSPSELLLGVHWSPRPLDLGLAVSHWIVRDPGAPPLRVVVTAAFR